MQRLKDLILGKPLEDLGPMPRNLNKIFSAAYGDHGAWSGYESGSGQGSSLETTKSIRTVLESLFILLHIESILDVPCGDFHWMSAIDLRIKYVGADVVEDLISRNRQNFPEVNFQCLDLITSKLPTVDLIFCRDCFGHLSFADCLAALKNFKLSSSKYMMLTTFWNHPNRDKETGPDWRARSMTKQPFNLPSPILTVDELCMEVFPKFSDKSMALWKI